MEESIRVLGIGVIREGTEKMSGQLPEKGRIRMSTEKMVESVRIPGIGRIRESTEKLSGRAPKNVECLRVPKNGRSHASAENR